MNQIILKEYQETKQKYQKFTSRLVKKKQNGTFYTLSISKQQTLLFRLKKLYNRLMWLKQLIKLSAAGATFSLAMAVQTNAQNITPRKIFKQKIKHPFENVRNFESDIFVQETGTTNPFGTINPLDGQIIPNGTDARLVDIDNDGDLDVFTYQETLQGSGSYGIKFYRNIGNKTSATLLESQSYSFGVTFQSKPYLSFVDLDNDGDQDAVVINGGAINLFENTGSAFVEHFGQENPFNFFSSTYMRYLSFADIDNDGDKDFFMQSYYGAPMTLYKNTGNADSAAFTPENADSLFQVPITNNVSSFILEDVDGDNDFDGILNGNYYYVNIGDATVPSFVEVNGGTNPFQNVDAMTESVITFSDIDDDSDMDLLVSNYNFFTYYENTGSINSPLYVNKSHYFNYAYLLIPDFVDIDNDGDYDMFLSEYDYYVSSYRIKFYKNTGSVQNPVFEEQTNLNNPLSNVYSDYFMPLDFVDIDMDGDKDLFVGNYYAPSMRFFKNIGTATNPVFQEKTGTENPLNNVVGEMCFPDFVDIDGDGDQDCFYSAYDTTSGDWMAKFMRNTGNIYNPSFQEDNNPISVSGDIFLPEFVDIDNDGDYDVFAGTLDYSLYNSWQIKFYKNTGNAYNPIIQEQSQSNNPLDIENIVPFISFVDIDNDGDKDCFIATSDGYNGQILFFRNKTINNNVQSVVQEPELVILPNPSSGIFEYNPDTFDNLPVDIIVTDISGKIVAKLEQIHGRKINVSYLEKGMYVLTITNSKETRKSKIIIE